MLDSTARAERIELTAPEAVCFAWEVAQKPVSVRLPLPLIDRLEAEAVEAFRSLTSRGSEIGGLLVGSHTPGSPSVVALSDFELISCDYSRGPLYRLSDSDVARFEQAMEKHAGNSAARVVGFFRSHTRKGLALDAEDLAFFEPRFLEPHHIAMLIRPFATKVTSAGIFIRENGKIGSESSYREFPFRSSELGSNGGGTGKSESVAMSGPAQSPAAPKPQSRAQIVPIASRREVAPPDPAVVTPATAAHEPQALEAAAPPAPQPQLAAPLLEKDEREKEKEKEKEKPAPVIAKVVEAPLEAAALAVPELLLPVAPAKNKKLRLIVAAAVGMLVLGGGGLIVYPTLMKRVSPRPAATPQDSSPLSLRVERTSGGMLLTWNRDLPVIQSASKVVLSISDGDRHENIELDPNQVRTGSILYPPITGDVSFQMEVTDPHHSKTTSESLRVLDPRPSPLDQPAAPAPASTTAAAKETPAVKPPAASTPEAVPTPAPAATDDTKATDDAAAVHPAANLKPFNSASLAERLRPVTPADVMEAPPTVRATPTAAGSLLGLVNNQTSVPAPPKPAAAAPAAKIGGQLVPARVVARVDPEYPKLAREAGASGVVELEATISADGRVKNPHVIHGNSMLQKAAIDAVMQWRYQPALLNGKPVESPVEIRLNFVTQGR
jgi:TonB family protein